MLKKLYHSVKALYSLEFPRTIAYMLQSTEYQLRAYLKWFWRVQDFSMVRQRRELDKTMVARLILDSLKLGMLIEVALGIVLVVVGISNKNSAEWIIGIALILALPVLLAQLICIPVAIARILIIKPKERQAVTRAREIFNSHKGIKIAVAGSYGKTSMKELLNTVLSQGKTVAVTPANKNVALSHAVFAKTLSGQEDILIVEFGEGAPGDVKRFSQTFKPDIAVITGIAPAHLDRYKTLDRAAKDIFSLSDFVDHKNIFVNKESSEAIKYLKPGIITYDRTGVLGWKVSGVKSDIQGLSFDLTKGTQQLKLSSTLLGRHQIGPLSLAAALAKQLGLNDRQIEEGIRQVQAYEHRMQPLMLSGAWVIDDTYNGNLEGIKAGTELLKELKAKRKIYITPGLVDQGRETKKIHNKVGQLIAEAKPDSVVLMKNSVTEDIIQGLKAKGYAGEINVQTDPLSYYSNLPNFIAAGDIVMMQNDWTDNYA